MKKPILGFLLALLISAPFAVSALSTGDVQSQINDLLSQIKTLQARLADLMAQKSTVATEPVSSGVSYSHRVCDSIKRNLYQGVRGDDVAALQEFLQGQGYFSDITTGYFGSATAQAVAKWQSSEGVQGIGTVGPQTRERLKIWCGGWQNTERFSATPTRGEAPLTVTFSTWLSGFRLNTIHYTVDFGDGTSERAADCYAPADACQSPGQNKHTYASNGTYTATLNKVTDPCGGNPACMAPIHTEVVGKVHIQVGATACTKEYQPVCGGKPVVCITAPCNPVPTTYGNRCMMNADGASFLYEGQCKDASYDPAKDPSCKSWYDGCNTCSRSGPNEPAMCTLRACMGGETRAPYCTAHFDGSSGNKPPVISGFSGPTALTLNQQGTWSIKASDPENGTLSYSILWGDEWSGGASMAQTSASNSIVQSSTFTHSYSNSGSYTVRITVTDGAGKTANTSATVQVSNNTVACTEEYSPVCGRPKGCSNICPPGAICTLECRLYPAQTYSNKCQLNAANADLLYEGSCTSTQ